jgi:transcriptional regulator with XRE-family HTH domain
MFVPLPFGCKVRKIRQARHLTQTALAKAARLSRPRLCDIERARRRARIEEVRCLAQALDMEPAELTRGTDWEVPRTPTQARRVERRFYRPFKFAPPRDRDFRVRLAAARRGYPERVARLEQLVDARRDRTRVLRFLMTVACDSDLEAMFILELLATGAALTRQSPQILGFRKHAIVHPATLEVVGHCRFPSLALKLRSLEVLLFPQVSLRPLLARRGCAQSQTHTVDFLIAVRLGSTVSWGVVEIDGNGHSSRGDREREEHLDLPAVRLASVEVTGPDPLSHLESCLSNLFT